MKIKLNRVSWEKMHSAVCIIRSTLENKFEIILITA